MRDLDKYKRHFVFDISSGYISGAVVYSSKENTKPVIEFATREKIETATNADLAELRKKTVIALDNICSSLADFVNLRVGEFFIESGSVFLSSPWVNFRNYNLKDEAIKPFTVSDYYLEGVLSSSLETNKRKAKKTLIDSQIVTVKANGYITNLNNIVGQSISNLEISALDSLMNGYNKKFIEKVINNHFPFLRLKFNSYLPVLFNQIRYIYDLEDDFIFLDVTDSVTEFGIFSDNKIINISSLPIGKSYILKEIISQGLASDRRIAQTIFSMYLRREVEENIKLKVKDIIDTFSRKLKEYIYNIFNKTGVSNIPINIFILTDKETRFLLRNSDIFQDPQKLIFIDENLIKKFVDDESNDFNPFLALEVEYVFYDK